MSYGYFAVMAFVMVESAGIPCPGETMLLAAAIYAGTTHQMSIELVIAGAALGAIIGDNVGYWLGRESGFWLIEHLGKFFRLDERKLMVGQYLFLKHGAAIVCWGRFIALLRVLAAFLAGVERMPWPRFLVANAIGGSLWATTYGLLGYFLGHKAHELTGELRIVFGVGAAMVLIGLAVALKKQERRIEAEAMAAFPGAVAAS